MMCRPFLFVSVAETTDFLSLLENPPGYQVMLCE